MKMKTGYLSELNKVVIKEFEVPDLDNIERADQGEGRWNLRVGFTCISRVASVSQGTDDPGTRSGRRSH